MNQVIAGVSDAIMGFAPDTVTYIRHAVLDYRSGDPKVRVVDLW